MEQMRSTSRADRGRPAAGRVWRRRVLRGLRGGTIAVAGVIAAVLVPLVGVAAFASPLGVAALVASLLPAAFIVAWLVLDDRAVATPLGGGTVFAVAVALGAIPAVANPVAGAVVGGASVLTALLLFGVLAPLLEEGGKFVAMSIGSDRWEAPMTGAAMGGVAGLGLAFTENALVLAPALLGGDVVGIAASRVVTASGHVAFGAIGGHVLASGRRTPRRWLLGLTVAGGLHGTYNLIAWATNNVAGQRFGKVAVLMFLLAVLLVAHGRFRTDGDGRPAGDAAAPLDTPAAGADGRRRPPASSGA